MAASAAAPQVAASTNTASISWSGSSTSLLALQVLGSTSVITAQALTTVPTQYTVHNGQGALAGTATVSISVGRPSGINLPVGRARGFGVYSVGGVITPSSERSATYQTVPIVGQFGFPSTTWVGTRNVSVAPKGNAVVPVESGLAGVNTGVTVSLLASFPVVLSVVLNGKTFTSSTTISVPVGAGIL